MPLKGRPIVKNNPFAQVGINKGRPKLNNSAGKNVGNGVGEELNKLAGKKKDPRFVDRKSHNKMGKDGFLKLLSHQLQNQDPLKPMDQKSFAADLAQFAQLEQMTNMNAKMDTRNKAVPTENKFYGASFLGKEILSRGTSVKFDQEHETKEIPFSLPKFAKKVMIRFYDAKNQLVGQIDHDNLGAGNHSLRWDGIGYNNHHVGKGDFRAEVRAWDDQLEEFSGETKSKGLITGVSFENGETVLTLKSGKKVSLRDVESFSMPGNISGTKSLIQNKKSQLMDGLKEMSQANLENQETNSALRKKALNSYNTINEGSY